jgi:hypothetical protein
MAASCIEFPDDYHTKHAYQTQVESISEVGEWTLEVVDRRSKRLAELAWRTISDWLEWE